jgi:hypothetical protein
MDAQAEEQSPRSEREEDENAHGLKDPWMAEIPRPAHGEAVADDDSGIVAAGIDDPENPVSTVLLEVLGLFSRYPVLISRSARIRHDASTPEGRDL